MNRLSAVDRILIGICAVCLLLLGPRVEAFGCWMGQCGSPPEGSCQSEGYWVDHDYQFSFYDYDCPGSYCCSWEICWHYDVYGQCFNEDSFYCDSEWWCAP